MAEVLTVWYRRGDGMDFEFDASNTRIIKHILGEGGWTPITGPGGAPLPNNVGTESGTIVEVIPETIEFVPDSIEEPKAKGKKA